jgi:hypothetical protein
MQLELTLGKTDSYISSVFTFLKRERFKINDESDFMKSVIMFLANNKETVSAATGDAEFEGKMLNLQSLSVADFRSLRMFLSMHGLELSFWSVADDETNPRGLASGTVEYNVIDEMAAYNGVSRYAQKITMSIDNIDLSYLYQKILSSFELFDTELLDSMKVNPIEECIKSIEDSQGIVGKTNPAVTQEAANIFNYLGLRYVAYKE